MKVLALVFALVAFPSVALADIPPPDDYVETCTVEKQTQPGVECQSCRAWHGEQDACDKTLGTQGYSRRCKSYGASAWNEVWCKGEPTGPAPAETPAPSDAGSKKTGCTGAGLPSLLGLLALALRRPRIGFACGRLRPRIGFACRCLRPRIGFACRCLRRR